MYIGKESNWLEDVGAGVVHDLDEVFTEYADPRHDPMADACAFRPIRQHFSLLVS
jgi:hypothetical protein